MMVEIIIEPSMQTLELERAITAEIMATGYLTIAGQKLYITAVGVDEDTRGYHIIKFDYRIPKRLDHNSS